MGSALSPCFFVLTIYNASAHAGAQHHAMFAAAEVLGV
jgi:hypothetical protein